VSALFDLFQIIAKGDTREALRRLEACPALATEKLAIGATRAAPSVMFLEEVKHHVYAGDTALHVAAAAHAGSVVRALLERKAEVAARNRRGAEPLHYAADGSPTNANWDPAAQADVIDQLVAAGANPDALDKSGVAPLHRAVRARTTGAVRALLRAGANPRLKNKNGSTPLMLCAMTTGRGGSGTAEAKHEQEAIGALLMGALNP
jgi:hypothetical protein